MKSHPKLEVGVRADPVALYDDMVRRLRQLYAVIV